MKKFLILGNMNAITYKEVFPCIKDNKIWTGYKRFGGGMDMILPEDDKGEIIKNIGGVIWFTNIGTENRHKPLELTKTYNEKEYPHYDNYDAINVDKVKDIPVDYYGVIGVPITFLGKYCPEQFEIIWTTDRGGDGMMEDLKILPFDKSWDSAWINGNKVYKRILIKLKK